MTSSLAHQRKGQEIKKKKKKGGNGAGAFGVLGLNDPICKALAKCGYKQPTPIQRKAIPPLIQGRDVVAMARTGSGKSAAFLLPLLHILGAHSPTVGVRGVVLGPTRELVLQLFTVCKQFSRFTDLRICVIVGGAPMEKQFNQLANNPDILIATPGRLSHHLVESDMSLSSVQTVILDEADQIFELHLGDQLQIIFNQFSYAKQCVVCSATLPSSLADFCKNTTATKSPVIIRLDQAKHLLTLNDNNLQSDFLYTRQHEKSAAFLYVINKFISLGETVLSFVSTRHHVEYWTAVLHKCGITAAGVYGSMDHQARTNKMNSFRKGRSTVLVVTDVGARGLDLPYLPNVVNYDFPTSSKLFLHRAGRTARMGRPGRVVSLVTLEDLPYTIELMLFAGATLHRPPAISSATATSCCIHLGGLPSLWHEIDLLAYLHTSDAGLASGLRSMESAYRLYARTRPPAARISVQRAKQFLRDVGGPTSLAEVTHPRWVEKNPKGHKEGKEEERPDEGRIKENLKKLNGENNTFAITDTSFPSSEACSSSPPSITPSHKTLLSHLRAYRPAPSRKWGALSCSAVSAMQWYRRSNDLSAYSTLERTGEHSRAFKQEEEGKQEVEQPTEEEKNKEEKENNEQLIGLTSSMNQRSEDLLNDRTATRSMSKRRRLQVAKLTEQGRMFQRTNSTEIDQQLPENTTHTKDVFKLTIPSREEHLAFQDKVLEIDSLKLDLMGDDRKVLKSHIQRRRWDAAKKRYVMCYVDEAGHKQKSKTKAESKSRVKCIKQVCTRSGQSRRRTGFRELERRRRRWRLQKLPKNVEPYRLRMRWKRRRTRRRRLPGGASWTPIRSTEK